MLINTNCLIESQQLLEGATIATGVFENAEGFLALEPS